MMSSVRVRMPPAPAPWMVRPDRRAAGVVDRAERREPAAKRVEVA